ncbi:MAG: 2-furoate---CoA ligase [Alphaproteobacteria bacterium]|jgi:2-furoate---CoA ligase
MFDLGRTLIAAAARNPHALALVDGDQRLSYAELLDRAQRLVSGLDAIGITRGDRLLIVLQNRAECAILHWATQLAGVIATPINWRANADEVEFFITNSAATAVVYESVSADAVNGSAAAAPLPRIAIGAPTTGSIDFEDLLAHPPAHDVPRATPRDVSLMLYTSGTTGRGKGVPRRHHAERAAAIAHVAQNTYRSGEVTLGVMPLYHTMGVRSLLAMALINGTFVCLPRFDVRRALELISAERVTNLYLVPTLYHDLLAHADFQTTDTTSVTKLGFAGAAMTDGLLARLVVAFAPELFVNHYGSSEIYTFTVEQNAAVKPGSAGRAGINTEVRVIGISSHDPTNIVATGEEGQIIATLDGDEAFEGYWKRPDADAKALHHGWYLTGDIGYVDVDGDLFVTGRVDDMIITGGENVLPAEIESILSMHPAVAENAVVGLADERWGQRVTAFVRRSAAVTDTELDSWCQQSDLANFKRPRAFIFVEDIPKSPVGKILRRMLVAGDYREEQAESDS